MLAQKASGVYRVENWPTVERLLLRSEGETIYVAGGGTVVGLTKVRPLTRVLAVEGDDCRFDGIDSPEGIGFASVSEVGIIAVGIGRPVDGVWIC